MKSVLLFAVLGLGLWGCLSKPTYPAVPSIEFVSIRRLSAGPGNDSVLLTFAFRDGDGDLGLGQEDTSFPFSFYQQDGVTPNPFYYNIFVDVFRRKPGSSDLDTIVFPDNATFNGRFPKINSLGTATPIRGEITYLMSFLYGLGEDPLFRKGDELIFGVKIADRSTNLSNAITSTPLILGGR
jgi:hypothetical protein